MLKIIITIASHLPVIGQPVREMIDITNQLNRLADPNVPMPENLLDIFRAA
jgi:hypothetical protein